MTDARTARLQRELAILRKTPVDGIAFAPSERDLGLWHVALRGAKSTDYEGGVYHATIAFPDEYPFKAPSIKMLTPSGRFEPGASICMSMTAWHPESWNPIWNATTLALGLLSFMSDDDATGVASIRASSSARRAFAKASMTFNSKNAAFVDAFPELLVEWAHASTSASASASAPAPVPTSAPAPAPAPASAPASTSARAKSKSKPKLKPEPKLEPKLEPEPTPTAIATAIATTTVKRRVPTTATATATVAAAAPTQTQAHAQAQAHAQTQAQAHALMNLKRARNATEEKAAPAHVQVPAPAHAPESDAARRSKRVR